jgi:double-stranded uracil-DNA glycosylase
MLRAMTRVPFVLEDVLQPGLRVVFCGTAPGRASAQQQAYYAHPQNKFWRILYETGLTPRRLSPQDYRELLTYDIGLTDIAKYTFGMDNQLPGGSLGRAAGEALRSRIAVCAPRILAFTSQTGGSSFLHRQVRPGAQDETIGATRIWVLPSPAPTAHWNWNPEPWFALAAAARTGSSGSPLTDRRKSPVP